MGTRHPPPRLLLMTDERLGDALWPALAALPRGAGVVFRHRSLPGPERRALWDQVRRVARRRGLAALLAGPPAQAIGWRADGAHGPSPHRRAARPLVRSRAAHDAAELVAAARAGADLVLLSPVFPTRSHPGARTLGPVRFGRLARALHGPAVLALGGVGPGDLRRLRALGAAGWAAIDGLVPGGARYLPQGPVRRSAGGPPLHHRHAELVSASIGRPGAEGRDIARAGRLRIQPHHGP